jgi:hypothetical protein
MTETAKRPSLKELLTDIFTDRRLALMLALGYSAGLPLRLVFSTQSAWLRESAAPRCRAWPIRSAAGEPGCSRSA